MCSGLCVVIVLYGAGAVAGNRRIMVATGPSDAAEGTLRKLYADSIGENAAHGFGSLGSAQIEIDYFFSALELH